MMPFTSAAVMDVAPIGLSINTRIAVMTAMVEGMSSIGVNHGTTLSDLVGEGTVPPTLGSMDATVVRIPHPTAMMVALAELTHAATGALLWMGDSEGRATSVVCRCSR